MKDDPFAQLGGLDQQLYKDQDNETTRQRDNATTSSRPSESTKEPTKESANAASDERPRERSSTPPKTPHFALSAQRLLEAKRTRASARTGHLAVVRAVERHSHDIYADQIRWMNRLKLDVLETYGTKVTSNEMVQLAIDLFRADFERNGESSQLMRVLVLGEEPDVDGGDG